MALSFAIKMEESMFKTTVKIDGMMCGMCEAHVNDAIRKMYPDAKKVTSSHKKGETSFLTETETSADEIRQIIEQTGYTFISCECVRYEKKGLFGGR